MNLKSETFFKNSAVQVHPVMYWCLCGGKLFVTKCLCLPFRSTCHTSTLWAVLWAWPCSMATTSMEALLCPSTNSCWVNPSLWTTWSLWILTCTTASSGSCTLKTHCHAHSCQSTLDLKCMSESQDVQYFEMCISQFTTRCIAVPSSKHLP